VSAWIFQGNPNDFDIDSYLRTHDQVYWNLGRDSGKRLAIGDRAFFWRSEAGRTGTGGFVGIGRVSGMPRLVEEHGSPGNRLWRDPPSGHTPKVSIKVDEVRIEASEGMLRRVDLLRAPELQGLTVLNMANRTMFRIEDPRHEARLEALWRSVGVR